MSWFATHGYEPFKGIQDLFPHLVFGFTNNFQFLGNVEIKIFRVNVLNNKEEKGKKGALNLGFKPLSYGN